MSKKINILTSNEAIQFVIKKHFLSFLPECIFLMVIIFFNIGIYTFFSSLIQIINENIFWFIFGSIDILCGILVGILILKKMLSISIITNRRIICFSKKEEYTFDNIKEIRSNISGFWQNTLGFGTLFITLKNNKQYILQNVPKVLETTRKIHTRIQKKKM